MGREAATLPEHLSVAHENGPLAVVVAENEWHYREALLSALGRVGDIEVIGDAATTEEALALVTQFHPPVALVDLAMPAMGGLELTRRIREAHAETAVIVLAASRAEEDVLEALRAGASGYLVTREIRDPSRLYEAIRVVAAGGSFLSVCTARDLVIALARRRPVSLANGYSLTRREREVLALLVEGASNRQIAEALVIGEQAVKNLVGSLLRKLDAPNRTAAAAAARRDGLTGAMGT